MTRWLLALSIVLLAALPAHAQWANEPSGSQVVVDCPMASSILTTCGITDVYNSLVYGSDGGDPVSPPSKADSILAGGQINGGSQLEKYFATANEIYVGTTVKVNTGFQSFICCASKMFFLRGPGWNTGSGTQATNGFFGLRQNFPTAPNWFLGFGHNTGSALNNSHICPGGLGEGYCEPNVNGMQFATGIWVTIEVYMKKSTGPTSRDGILRWWGNGTLLANYTTLNYPGGFSNWLWTETYGGMTDTVPNPRIYSIGHVRISLPNNGGGPITPPPPPPLPPNKPSNVRVQ